MAPRPNAVGALLVQEFDAATLHQLREAVLAHASAAGMPEERAVDVMLVAHELAANAVRHGAGSGRIRMEVADGVLRCQVSDAGPTRRSGRAAGAAAATRWPVTLGRGLWVAHNAAKWVSTAAEHGRSVVTAAFDMPAGQRTADG